ncbi:MAG: signal peptidase I [Verrucomicrobiia bacterium]
MQRAQSFPARLRFVARWFGSRTIRRATDFHRQVRRIVNEQRDQLRPDAISAMAEAGREFAQIVRSGDADLIRKAMGRYEEAANEHLLPYPHGAARENVKEMLVAITVIFAFTSFFLQLTKIPTNSLLPTLYGITSQDLRDDPGFKVPGFLTRVGHYWGSGISYYHVVAKADGPLQEIESPRQVLPFVKKQRIRVGGEWYTIWFPPERLEERTRLNRSFRKGEDILKLRVVAGDHLLVDRLTYNFRRPRRGEIFVFKTKNISGLPPGQLYIKRLVGLSGESVRIGNDQHLVINGERLDASTPRFENVYTFPPHPVEHQYFGHVNGATAMQYGRPRLAPLFQDESREHVVGSRHYLAMGDNTLNSSDSRAWGDVPRENVIGKCWFVYWPFGERFGWGTR